MSNKYKDWRKGFVVSDLHLDTSRTSPEVEKEIGYVAAKSDFCVLNGDIFDFKWSESESTLKAIEFAIVWLEKLCKNQPHFHFYYVFGNHDCLEDFVEQLDLVKVDNFSYHRTHLFFDDKLFLHGDLPLSDCYPFYQLKI